VLLADEPEKMLDTVHRDLVQRELVRLAETRLVLVSSHTPRFDLTPPERHYEVRGGSVLPLRADPA
jgi:ABC-type lipoprotein export system ATPase subunit